MAAAEDSARAGAGRESAYATRVLAAAADEDPPLVRSLALLQRLSEEAAPPPSKAALDVILDVILAADAESPRPSRALDPEVQQWLDNETLDELRFKLSQSDASSEPRHSRQASNAHSSTSSAFHAPTGGGGGGGGEEKGERPTGRSALESVARRRRRQTPDVLDERTARFYRKKIHVYAFRTGAAVRVFKAWGVSASSPRDWLIVSQQRDVYVCPEEAFARTYQPVAGRPHVYRKVGRVLAACMREPFRLRNGERGNAGDYLVQDSTGAQWIVSKDVFESTYQLDEADNAAAPTAATGITASTSASTFAAAAVAAAAAATAAVAAAAAGGDASARPAPWQLQARFVTPPAAAALLRASMDEWEFDVFQLDAASEGHALSAMAMAVCERLQCAEKFDLHENGLARFALALEAGSGTGPYHNALHAAEVLHAIYFMLRRTRIADSLQDFELFAAVLAALSSSVAHPCVSNSFLCRSGHDLALTYNERSVSENHRCARLFAIARECGLFERMAHGARRKIRRLAIDMVLACDPARHLDLLAGWSAKAERGALRVGEEPEDRLLLLSLALCAAELSHCAKPWPYHQLWTERRSRELLNQGDLERAAGLPLSAFANRADPQPHLLQQAIIVWQARPLFSALSRFLQQPHERWLALLDANGARHAELHDLHCKARALTL